MLVHRKIYNQVTPMVEYYLTDLGKKLLPILKEMDIWEKEFVNKIPSHN